jgi:RimJ/RimL family protein N-acetyltransferase
MTERQTDPWQETPILEGKWVRLEPMSIQHIPGLLVAGEDPSIWKYMVYGNLSLSDNLAAWVNGIIQSHETGTDMPFTVFLKARNVIIGATRFLDMRPPHRGLEIGGTWYSPEHQGTMVNAESKYLLLSYAFDTLKCIRVQFKADVLNNRSITGIEKLGAVREGVFRNHLILTDGRLRDSVVFSILESEWKTVKARMQDRLIKCD